MEILEAAPFYKKLKQISELPNSRISIVDFHKILKIADLVEEEIHLIWISRKPVLIEDGYDLEPIYFDREKTHRTKKGQGKLKRSITKEARRLATKAIYDNSKDTKLESHRKHPNYKVAVKGIKNMVKTITTELDYNFTENYVLNPKGSMNRVKMPSLKTARNRYKLIAEVINWRLKQEVLVKYGNEIEDLYTFDDIRMFFERT